MKTKIPIRQFLTHITKSITFNTHDTLRNKGNKDKLNEKAALFFKHT